MATRAELREELIKAGIRPSVQRLAIFEYVRQSCEHPTAEVVYEALCDDLNTPIALSHLFDAVRIVNQVKDGTVKIGEQEKSTLEFLLTTIATDVMGIAPEQEAAAGDSGVTKVMDALVNMVLEERKVAKANKDWAKSDKIRDDLKAIGIQIKDTKDGIEWTLE